MEPRPKRNCRLKVSAPLPLLQNSRDESKRFRGVFNGFSVIIDDEEDMKILISMGYFGKATLSRNYPQFQKKSPEIIRRRVFENRRSKTEVKTVLRKVVVLPDSDSDDDQKYFTNLKPEYQLDYSKIQENVNLNLEEAFFLAAALNCLDIITHDGKKLDIKEMWDCFKESDTFFAINYVVYYYFRSKNWVVKTGIKFGGDFLLYKQGPPFYHASYVVIIHVVDEKLQKIQRMRRRSMENLPLMGLHRLCETAGKELLICEVICPDSLNLDSFNNEDLQKFTIKETLMKRWISTQKTT